LTTRSSDADVCVTSARTDDVTLVARIQTGDQNALAVLMDRYTPVVANIGSRILRDPGEARELVQDTFFHIYKKCHLFDETKGSFRSWLIQIASHRAFDRREYLNLHRVYEGRNLDDFLESVHSACDVEYQAQIKQSEATLRQAFEQLSSKQRATLELYFFEGYTLREISQQLNESLANIRHYYYRALERLRTSIGKDSLKDD